MQRVRLMRLIVFFDLPNDTYKQKKSYRLFRKHLLKNGYLMMQESVYSKLAINSRIADGLIAQLHSNKPPEGLVQVLKITEKQYETIEFIAGGPASREELEDTDSLIVL